MMALNSGNTQDLRDVLFVRAYDQAISEYESWDTYRKEQWLSFLKCGRDDLMDLAMALLSAGRRVQYPIAALDLAAYTLARFGLDADLAKYPVQGLIYNERTRENDPFQFLDLKIRFGATVRSRLHLGPHLLARCAVFAEGGASDYLHVLLSAGVYPHDIVVCTHREMEKMTAGACPYEQEAARLFRNDPDGLRRAKEFFYDEKWPSPELLQTIDQDFAVLQDLARVAKGLQPPS